MRRKRELEEVEVSKAWLDSYADAITLLMAFFVMLFAFSLVDKKKFDDFKFGIAEAFGKPNPTVDGGTGLLDRGTGLSPGLAIAPIQSVTHDGNDFDVSGEVNESGREELKRALLQSLETAGVDGDVTVQDDPRGLVIHLTDKVLFDSGSALIRVDGALVLNHLAEVLKGIDNQLVVEGHTDNVPTLGTEWPTNWELSTSRATHVLRWLVEGRGIPAVRVSAAGYADTRPIASNLDEAGRQVNRRVEIVVLLPKDASADGQEEDG